MIGSMMPQSRQTVHYGAEKVRAAWLGLAVYGNQASTL